jgi:hypothetical protein
LQYPDLLKPSSCQRVVLPSSREVQVPKATPRFLKWAGDVPNDTYNKKPILEFNREMVFAELAILRAFQQDGWQGRWIDSYRHKHRVGYWGEHATKALPAEQQAILDGIRVKAGCAGGCFDVLCWRDGTVVFAESKWRGHDRIRSTQRRWLEVALSIGFPLSSFLIVEWALN